MAAVALWIQHDSLAQLSPPETSQNWPRWEQPLPPYPSASDSQALGAPGQCTEVTIYPRSKGKNCSPTLFQRLESSKRKKTQHTTSFGPSTEPSLSSRTAVTDRRNPNPSRPLCTPRELLEDFLLVRLLRLYAHVEDKWEGGYNVFAATAILHFSASYYENGLRSGKLRQHVSNGLGDFLLSWFRKAGLELEQWLWTGCGTYPSWQSSTHGSIKRVRPIFEAFALCTSCPYSLNLWPHVLTNPCMSHLHHTANAEQSFADKVGSRDIYSKKSIPKTACVAESEEGSFDASDVCSSTGSHISDDGCSTYQHLENDSNGVCKNDVPIGLQNRHVVSMLEPVERAMVDRIMKEFWVLFNQEWSSYMTERTNHSPASTNTYSGDIVSSNTSFSSTSQLKRKLDEGDGEPADDNGDKKRGFPNGSSRLMQESPCYQKLACPFHKHNALKYSIRYYRKCALGFWPTISRVKEHILRNHRMPIHCGRCWEVFENELQHDSHMKAAPSDMCLVAPGEPPEGISPQTEKLLRSRKKSHRNENDEERWKNIYRILFSGDAETPSPYFEESKAGQDNTVLSLFENHIRSELPRVVEANVVETFQRGTKPVEEHVIASLINIIRDSQETVFETFHNQGICFSSPTMGSHMKPAEPPVMTRIGLSNSSKNVDVAPRPTGFLAAIAQTPTPQNRDYSVPDLRYEDNFGMLGGNSFSQPSYNPTNNYDCACSGPCSCFRTTISSKSREIDATDSKMNQPADTENANFQLDDWLSPAWNNFEPTDQGTG